MRPPVFGLTRQELDGHIQALGFPRFRAEQLWRWLYTQRESDPARMANLPAAFRGSLETAFDWTLCAVESVVGAERDTRKALVRLRDGERVEMALIPGRNKPGASGVGAERRTVCVSSQVGCRFSCAFCASGRNGLKRQADASEIVGQVLEACRLFGAKATHVVFMGVGEPFDNWEHVLRAIRIVNDPHGLAIGARRITLSTCGLIPGIRALAAERIQVELSVSLHSPFDAVRDELMPVNRAYPLNALIDACATYARETGRIVTFEYTLIRGINDRDEDLRALLALLDGCPCRMNLIMLNPVDTFSGKPTTPERAAAFRDRLTRAGIHTTLRVSKGVRVRGACGQLRTRQGSATREHSA